MTERSLAVVLVAALDRRTLPGLALVPMLRSSEGRALHLDFEPEASHALARDWMEAGITWLPLHIEEPPAADLAASVRAIIEREIDERSWITVIVPEVDLGRWWQPLLHRGSGRAVAWSLHDLPRVTTVVVPVRLDLEQRHPVEPTGLRR